MSYPKEQEKIELQNKFADLLRKTSQKQIKKKSSKVTIEEIPVEDATPRYERKTSRRREVTPY